MPSSTSGQTSLGILVLVAAAAFAGGYLVGTSSTVAPPRESHTAADAPIDAVERGNTLPSVVLEGTRSGERNAVGDASLDPSAIREWIRSLPAIEPLQGDGTIAGKVITQAGEPISGVEIVAIPSDPSANEPLGSSTRHEDRLVAKVRYVLRYERWKKANEHKATTAADGTFRLEGMPKGNYQVRASADGWRIHRRGHSAITDGSNVTFVGTKRTSCRLAFGTPSGVTPTRAEVNFKSPHSERRSEWTPTNDTIDIQPGIYRVEVRAGEHSEFTGLAHNVEIREGETNELEIDLKQTPVLLVRVEFPEGEESDICLLWMPSKQGTPVTEAMLLSRGSVARRSHGANRNRVYILSNLLSDRLHVGLVRGAYFHPGVGPHVVEGFEEIPVRAGVNRHTLQAQKLAASRYVAITVRGPAGESIPVATFSADFKSDKTNMSAAALTTRAVGGRQLVLPMFDLAHVRGKGTFGFNVQTQVYGSKRVEVDELAGQEIVVRFGQVAIANVRVEGIKSLDLGNESVRVYVDEHGRVQENHVCDGDGRVTLSSLQPGSVTLGVSIQSTSPTRSQVKVHSETVKLSPGTNTVRLRLPTLYEVIVRGGSGLTMVSPQDPAKHRGFHRMARSSDGEAVFPWMPPGEYIVRSGTKTAEFTLPGDTEVQLREPPSR